MPPTKPYESVLCKIGLRSVINVEQDQPFNKGVYAPILLFDIPAASKIISYLKKKIVVKIFFKAFSRIQLPSKSKMIKYKKMLQTLYFKHYQ